MANKTIQWLFFLFRSSKLIFSSFFCFYSLFILLFVSLSGLFQLSWRCLYLDLCFDVCLVMLFFPLPHPFFVSNSAYSSSLSPSSGLPHRLAAILIWARLDKINMRCRRRDKYLYSLLLYNFAASVWLCVCLHTCFVRVYFTCSSESWPVQVAESSSW